MVRHVIVVPHDSAWSQQFCQQSQAIQKVFRKRFDEPTIQALLDLQWWHWDIAKITRNLKAICGSDLEALRQAV